MECMLTPLTCGRCGKVAQVDKVGFRDECPHCREPLHICRNCRFYDPAKYNHCHEPRAERVVDAEKENRCDWFEPRGGGASAGPVGREKAEQMLKDLFKK